MSASDYLRALKCPQSLGEVRCLRRWLHEDGHVGHDGLGWRTWISPPPASYADHELKPGWEERAIEEVSKP